MLIFFVVVRIYNFLSSAPRRLQGDKQAVEHAAREGSGLSRNLTLRSLIITRFISSFLVFFVVSVGFLPASGFRVVELTAFLLQRHSSPYWVLPSKSISVDTMGTLVFLFFGCSTGLKCWRRTCSSSISLSFNYMLICYHGQWSCTRNNDHTSRIALRSLLHALVGDR